MRGRHRNRYTSIGTERAEKSETDIETETNRQTKIVTETDEAAKAKRLFQEPLLFLITTR